MHKNLILSFIIIIVLLSCMDNKSQEVINEIYSVDVHKFISSGYLKGENSNYTYSHEKAFDNNPETCWVEGDGLSGIGEYLGILLSEKITVDEIKVMPGFFNIKYYYKNNSVLQAEIELDDYIFTYSFNPSMNEQEIELDNPIQFSRFKFSILNIAKGTEWDDTCVSEIQFYLKGKRIQLEYKQEVLETEIMCLLSRESWEKEFFLMDFEGSSFCSINYFYDNNGLLMKKEYSCGQYDYEIFKYYDTGQLLKMDKYYSDGDIFESHTYTYYPEEEINKIGVIK